MLYEYNNQKNFRSNISKTLLNRNNNIRKFQFKIIPRIILSMILSKSCVSSNIDKELKHEFSLIKFDFVSKRIKHLFSNKLFEFHSFYDSIIQNIIKTYQKKHHHQILVL